MSAHSENSSHTFPYRSTQSQEIYYVCSMHSPTQNAPEHMALHYDDTGPNKSTVTIGPSEASSTNPFSRSLLVGNPNKMETAYMNPTKGERSYVTLLETLTLPDNAVLHLLTDRTEKPAEEMYSALTTTRELN